ncbi:hypothetical protein [Faecalibaculum rodentium]|uniref:hypothetical protein n=1 Tax=Faecalibaculum rodentium TaxID=1702221 RepID=UPI0023F0DE8B|nr:hypothetical protein [Faecalibaculum rodentium]
MMTTSTGFEYQLPEGWANDWDLIEYITDMTDENPSGMVHLLRKLLGPEQYKALKEHVRKTNGAVTTSAMIAEMNDIMGNGTEAKNFSPSA